MDPVTVTATFDKLDGSGEYEKSVDLFISRTDEKYGPVLQMRGGPTGYESFYVRSHRAGAWLACFGTQGRYQRCVVSAAEMERALNVLLENNGDSA